MLHFITLCDRLGAIKGLTLGETLILVPDANYGWNVRINGRSYYKISQDGVLALIRKG